MNRLGGVGRNFSCDSSRSVFVNPESMKIGDDVFIGEQAHFGGEITIGNNVMFGPRPMILAGNHYFAVKGKNVRFLHPKDNENSEPVLIEDEVWCGASIVILGGVCLGMGCVIGAGSVVSKSIPPYVVAVGNSAKPIRKIFEDKILKQHLIKLGKDSRFAGETVNRRNRELARWKLTRLKSVDRSSEYWEFKEGD
jgi:acetyltransferase-like isoleucine patch superfamily enzyme